MGLVIDEAEHQGTRTARTTRSFRATMASERGWRSTNMTASMSPVGSVDHCRFCVSCCRVNPHKCGGSLRMAGTRLIASAEGRSRNGGIESQHLSIANRSAGLVSFILRAVRYELNMCSREAMSIACTNTSIFVDRAALARSTPSTRRGRRAGQITALHEQECQTWP
jgi:hypothetical protein